MTHVPEKTTGADLGEARFQIGDGEGFEGLQFPSGVAMKEVVDR